MIRQNRQRRGELGQLWSLHPKRCLHREGALLHHADGETWGNRHQTLQRVSHEHRGFASKIVDCLLPLAASTTLWLLSGTIGTPRPRGELDDSSTSRPPQCYRVAPAALGDTQLKCASMLREGNLGGTIEVEATKRLWRSQDSCLNTGLVVQTDWPPPEVRFFIRCAVAKGVERPYVRSRPVFLNGTQVAQRAIR